MRAFVITITMPDGSRGQHHGIYEDGFEAVITALVSFPGAKRISARRIGA